MNRRQTKAGRKIIASLQEILDAQKSGDPFRGMKVTIREVEFKPEHETYLRREVRRGIDQLDRKEYADFSAETIIAQERLRMAGKKGPE